MQVPTAMQNQHSTIGKSIVIKGSIEASVPLYIYGCVEGSINAPEQRVTIEKAGRAKADISAREVVIMGDVCGNLDGGERVEVRTGGSLLGDLAADRISVEEGAFLKGTIDVRKASENEKAETREEPHPAFAPQEATSMAESNLDRETWANFAVPEPA